MKSLKYITLMVVILLCSCKKEPLQADDTTQLTPTYHIYNPNTSVPISVGVFDMYIYQSHPIMVEFGGINDSDCDTYIMEDFVDNSNDLAYDFAFTRVQDVKDGEVKRRLNYSVKGSKDRTLYADPSGNMLRAPIVLTIMDGITGETLEVSDGVEIFMEMRSIKLP